MFSLRQFKKDKLFLRVDLEYARMSLVIFETRAKTIKRKRNRPTSLNILIPPLRISIFKADQPPH